MENETQNLMNKLKMAEGLPPNLASNYERI